MSKKFLMCPDFSLEKSAGTPNPATCAAMTRGCKPRKWQASVGWQRAITIFILVTFLTLVPSTHAVSPSPLASLASPTGGPNPPTGGPLPTVSDDEVKKSLMERIKNATDEKSAEAEKILSAKTKIAVIGKLEDIANQTLTIRLQNNSESMAAVDETTVFVRKNKTVKLTDLQIKDYVIAMGYKNGKEILEAKRVVANDQEPEKNINLVLYGTIGKIDIPKKTFEFIDNAPAELGGPNTYLVTASKTSKVDIEKLTDKSVAVIIGTPAENPPAGGPKSLTLKALRVISSPAPVPSPTKIPSASSTPKISPTPKTSPTPKS